MTNIMANAKSMVMSTAMIIINVKMMEDVESEFKVELRELWMDGDGVLEVRVVEVIKQRGILLRLVAQLHGKT